MSLKDKFSKVNLGQIVADGEAKRRTGTAVDAAKTAVGFHVETIYSDRKLAEDNEKLRAELDQYQGMEPAKRLNPKAIHPSRWANRLEASFSNSDFVSLKNEIESSGGNVQAIKVRPMEGRAGEYEIIFGHRRHRACLELGISVLAVIEPLSDMDLFAQMDRENRQRADLRPFEQGVMYAKALDEGMFPSMRKMAEAIGVDVGGVSKLVALARLPADILDAFPSPLDIQFDWGAVIGAALQKDPDAVLGRARDIAGRSPRPGPATVYKELVSLDSVESLNTPPTVLKGKGGATAKIVYDEKRGRFQISLVGIDPKMRIDIEKVIKGLIN